MDENAVLGPVDSQLGRYPASSILAVTQIKDVNETDDETLILASGPTTIPSARRKRRNWACPLAWICQTRCAS